MKLILTAILFSIAGLIFAQTYPLSGTVFSDDGNPMVYSSVVLLNPADSTMQSFGITNKSGEYDIKSIKEGNYLLQVAFLGFETFYQDISIPAENNQLGAIVLKTKTEYLDEVEVTGEYIPLAIKKDTVEYNAKAFKLKPDAVTEDLLKKLPGVEVDRSGNIKAMGEDVNKLFVDGKEFFGNDPKVATKNVPANAVDKVQLYDRKSEQAMFTGIDDGSREKAINLKLKEDRKNALFGDVMAGGGTNERWQGSAKAYRFTDKVQLAALGMGNNVNQYGFSFNDYMNFQGGIGKMIHGGGSAKITIRSDGSFPINFGDPIPGLNTSGAGGANFSFSKHKHDRTFISYLGSGTEKILEETTKSWNYQKDKDYYQSQELNEKDNNQSHGFNFGMRKRIDSTQNVLLDGNFSLGKGKNNRLAETESSSNNELVNTLRNQTSNTNDRLSGRANGSYTKILNKGKSNFSVGGNLSVSTSLTENIIDTETRFMESGQNQMRDVFQDNKNESLSFSLNTNFTKSFGKGFYMTPNLKVGRSIESLFRTEGSLSTYENKLENDFQKRYSWFRPEINLKKTNDKRTISLSLQAETGRLENTLNENAETEKNYFYLIPSLWYQYEFQTGRRIMLSYRSSVNTPNVTQLLPIENSINPLSIYYGNPELKPEYSHRFNTHYILFDQFSFTSLMANLSGTYTTNKINWDRTVDEHLAMINTLQNFDYDYNLSGNIDFSTPIRRLGLKIHLNLDESWNKGLNLINGIENEYSNLSHRASFSIDNRKKEKWDVNTGVAVTMTDSKYSIQKELDNTYFDMSWFAEARWTPNDSWNFEVNTDITNYTDKSFGEDLSVPLVGAEISHFFLKHKRGTLSLKGFDLLNKNQLVKRFGELNYLREIRSNSIGRFVMLSFTYRLNKFGKSPGGIDIKMKK
ncbi:MAG: outer membrane beta-barrel protein [Draconibacterium sp.]|nr:outer membrane beta-barrel protein [Draconibacterium sp.]